MENEDGLAVRSGLRGALASSGLTQAGFARALGTSPSRFSTYLAGRSVPGASFYLRALRIGGGLRVAASGHWMTPIGAAAAIADALRGGDDTWAFRMVLQGRDHTRALLGQGETAAWEARPDTTGSEKWDRLLAALVAHEYETAGHRVPSWTQRDPTDRSWTFRSPYFDEVEVRRRTPAWLAELQIYLPERDLMTA